MKLFCIVDVRHELPSSCSSPAYREDSARRASGTKDEENDPGPTVHTLQLPRFYLPCLKAIKGLESLQSRALQLSRDAYPRTPHLKKQWRR